MTHDVEVFKTDVKSRAKAKRLVMVVLKNLAGCRVSFDLEDCDKVLRIQSFSGPVDTGFVIRLLAHHGCRAEPLTDEVPSR